ncbi:MULTISPECIES: DUF742 domain-containing protein [Streptomyces]|uniref:DUF742 domain-containing protein n=1 Tax=Streptomyces TaxID=1883 RepID=UPI001670E34D|nr:MULTISPECIES: DUF742 domain-containing protein [Streptomyces]UFR05512.1 DUF742 domain-containing protein [Streptomyces sp. Go40/10]GGS72240.1 hypothetical protein GCM10010206_38390 [Streptomyces cinerochromogenes]
MTPPRRTRRRPQPLPAPPAPQPAQPYELPQPPSPEAAETTEAAAGRGPGSIPERLYSVTGSGEGGRAELDLVTLIMARCAPPVSATPEQAAVLRLCQAPLSVAELSAYLRLPFSTMTVLLTELITAELVQAHAPVVRQALPDRSLLEAVMHGLQRL